MTTSTDPPTTDPAALLAELDELRDGLRECLIRNYSLDESPERREFAEYLEQVAADVRRIDQELNRHPQRV